MIHILRRRNFYMMLLMDAALVAAAYTLAFLLRFDGHIPLEHYAKLKDALPFRT